VGINQEFKRSSACSRYAQWSASRTGFQDGARR